MAPDSVTRKVWTLVCTSCCAGWPMTVDHGECKLCGGELELRGYYTVIDLPKGTDNMGMVERRTAQVKALADCKDDEARRIIQEFTDRVATPEEQPLDAYSPGRIVEWWRREHATEPRRW